MLVSGTPSRVDQTLWLPKYKCDQSMGIFSYSTESRWEIAKCEGHTKMSHVF